MTAMPTPYSRRCRRSAPLRWLLPALAGFAASAAAAADAPYADTLAGDWGGRRSSWRDAGYDWQLVYKADLVKRLDAGGPGKLRALDNLDLKLDVDGMKAFGLGGTRLFLHLLSNRGAKPAAESGGLADGIDNIEVPENGNTTKVFELYWEQRLLGDRVGLLFGLFDLNSEFYSTPASALFLHPTFGTGAELGGSGRNGPSIFPNAALALRLRYDGETGTYASAAVFDGVPGDPENLHGNHVRLDKGDGSLAIAEAGSGTLQHGRLAVGGWSYTAKFPSLAEVDGSGRPVPRPERGAYVLAEKRLAAAGAADVDGFLRYGRATSATLHFDRAFGAGVVGRGLVAARPADEIGLAYAWERNSPAWRASRANAPPSERSLELIYRLHLAPGLIVQPVLEYLADHGSEAGADRVWFAIVRCELNF